MWRSLLYPITGLFKPTGSLQRLREFLNALETLIWLFGKGFEYDLFNSR